MTGPPAPVPSAAGQNAPSKSARSLKPLVSLKSHKGLAIVVIVAIAILGLPIAWVKGKPSYYSEDAIYVSPRYAKNLTEDVEFQLQSNSQYREFVQQQVRTIPRYDIVEETLKRLGPQRALWQQEGESDRRATERLMGALQVHPVPDTYRITVGLEGRKSEGLAEIVNTMVEAYLAKQKQQEFYGSDARVENLTKRRTELVQEIQTRIEGQTKLAQELGITTFEEKFIIVARLDPIKRVDLVFDALESLPHLDKLSVRILGTGWDSATLQARTESRHPNVTVAGFSANVAAELAAADLLLHPCPAEPFGLAVLEAMAAGVPVLVADTGGAASLVDEGVSDFHFHANDAEALAQRLSDLAQASPVQLNSVVAGGYRAFATRFSAAARLADYRRLLDGGRP